MLGVIGREVGDNWEEWRDNLHYLDYAVLAAILILAVYLLLRRRRGGPDEGDAPDRESRPEPASARGG
jgi:hypothetical protein